MEERHENEQYFFAADTIERLASFLESYESVCCLAAPTLGRELARRGQEVRVLDIDERFRDLPGFAYWDIARPTWRGEHHDVIVCDPPFFGVSLSQLFDALRVLTRYDFSGRVLVSYLTRREKSLLSVFADFDLRASGFRPRYETVDAAKRNDIELYTNLDELDLARLREDDGEVAGVR